MSQPDSQSTKIVLIEGQRFWVPRDTSEQQIRETLGGSFPGIANARADTATLTIGDQTYETLTFNKVAGTKGSAALADELARLQPAPPVEDDRPLIRRLVRGRLTIGEALEANLFAVLTAAAPSGQEGLALCSRLERPGPIPIAGDVLV